MNTISLTMIVKNEASHLAACLTSVKEKVDEIIIVDTGSTDGTLELARAYADQVYSYTWEGDFSAARNFAITKATGDWILSLDADEELIFPGRVPVRDLRELTAQDASIEAYLLPLDNPTSMHGANRFYVLRLFRNNGHYRYIGRIHEQVTVADQGVVGIAHTPLISHKLLPLQERNRKRGRNLTILQESLREEPENYFLKYYLGVEWLMLAQPARALSYLQSAYENLTDDHLLFRAPALRYLVLCLQTLGRLDEGICLCLEAAEHYPEFTDVYYLGGVLLEEKQAYGPAIKWFKTALECGTPPALFSHLQGSGSFLAWYHLGYCQSCLGQGAAAQQAYVQALRANPQYPYPIYGLIQSLEEMHGAAHTLQKIMDHGFLQAGDPDSGLSNSALPLAAAEYFFASGHPDLARRCLEEGLVDEEVLFYRAKYSIFSGHLRLGLNGLDSLKPESKFTSQAKFYRTVALLLLGQFPLARAQAFELWQDQATRPQAHLFYRLMHLMEKGISTLPGPSIISPGQTIREVDLLPLSLDYLSEGSCFQPAPLETTLISRYIKSLETLVKNVSPEGRSRLLQFYQSKSEEVQNRCQARFGKVGNV